MTHWTHKLFIDNAELYLPFLEAAKERAPQEINALAELFSELGVPSGGRVLDVACGIGRHSVPLAQRGYEVIGLDLSPLFIEKAREYADSQNVKAYFLQGDALDVGNLLSGQTSFDAFINMFTSHSYYGREGDLRMFRQLRELASPGAALVVLTANRDWIVSNFLSEGMEKAGDIRILQRRSFDFETSMIFNDWEFYEGEGQDLRLLLKLAMEHRLYSLHELRQLLEEAGWSYQRGLAWQDESKPRLGSLRADSKDMWVAAKAE